MNRYLLLRLRHLLCLVRYHCTFLLFTVALIATTAFAAEKQAMPPLVSNIWAMYQSQQQNKSLSDTSNEKSAPTLPPLKLQSQATETEHLPEISQDIDSSTTVITPPIALYSPLIFLYQTGRTEQSAIPQLSVEEIVNNEFLHDTITELISQHETPIEPAIELVSTPLQISSDSPIQSEVSDGNEASNKAGNEASNPHTIDTSTADTSTADHSAPLPVTEMPIEVIADDAMLAIASQKEAPTEERTAEAQMLESAPTTDGTTTTSDDITLRSAELPAIVTDVESNKMQSTEVAEVATITEENAPVEINDSNAILSATTQHPIPADQNEATLNTEPFDRVDSQESLSDELNTIEGVLATQKSQEEIDQASQIAQAEDEPINNYLLYALFPHHKKSVIEAPLSKSYKESQDDYNHEDHASDLSIMKLVDKIDHSLSFNEDTIEGTIDEDSGLEAELAEGYFDSYQDYQQHYKTLDGDEVLSLESQSYPYAQDPQLEEALSSTEFEDLSTNQQIEQLLTTGDYYILADDVVKGRQYYIQAVRIGAKDKNAPIYAKALVKLADLEDNPYLARFQYTNALDIYETHLGFDIEIADILVKLVWTFDVTTERIVIYELLTRAKQILEKYSYTPQYTMVLRNLAIYYEAVNDFENADANYQAALALDLEHLGANDIRTVLALENYAAFYLKFREYQKAEEILLFKLKAHEEAETTDYYNLGRTQSMLGWTYLQQKNLDDALHYYNAALGNINYSITKNRFMPHYYSLPAIFDLIYFFNITEDPERGVPYFEVARALLESENEGSILDYLKETPKEAINLERIVNYPWAATAEIEGLITMMHYINQH